MLIRSQDKTILTNMDDKVIQISRNGSTYQISIYGIGDAFVLGRYSTIKKAEKVMGLLDDAYRRLETSKVLINRMNQSAPNVYQGVYESYIFQMPKNTEVE